MSFSTRYPPLRSLSVLALLLGMLASCQPKTAVTLTPGEAAYAPSALVTLPVPAGVVLEQDSYPGTLGQTAVQVVRTGNSDALAFELPSLAAGTYSLAVELDANQATAQIHVVEAPAIADPTATLTATIDASQSLLSESQTMFASSGLFTDSQRAQLAAKAQEVLQQAEDLLAGASPSEQEEVAQFIAANPGLFESSATAPRLAPTRATEPTTNTEWCVPGVTPEERMEQVWTYIESQRTTVQPLQTYRDIRERGGSRFAGLKAAILNLSLYGKLINILNEAMRGTTCAITRFGEITVQEMSSGSGGLNESPGATGQVKRVGTANALSSDPEFVKKKPTRIRLRSQYQSLSSAVLPAGSTLASGLSTLQGLLGWAADFFGVEAFRFELVPSTPRLTEQLPVSGSYVTASLDPAYSWDGLTWSYVVDGSDLVFTFDAELGDWWDLDLFLDYEAPHEEKVHQAFHGVLVDPEGIEGTWQVTLVDYTPGTQGGGHWTVFSESDFDSGDTWELHPDGTATLFPVDRKAAYAGFYVPNDLFGGGTFSLSADEKTLQLTLSDGTIVPTMDVLGLSASSLVVGRQLDLDGCYSKFFFTHIDW